MSKKLIVITKIDGKVKYVDEWDEEETKKLLPNQIYFGRELHEGKDYIVFDHDHSGEDGVRE
jgi:hypothetical protein